MGMPPATGTAGTRTVPARPAAPPAWPLRPGVVITVAALLGLGLRIFQLTRPGYLTGFTQYDDGVYIGNALRLVSGVIPYRDFAMVQPPGSMLLMVPAALVGKAFGSMSALATARILTVGADTANVVLAGLLVRHRGPLAAGVASGGYAVYPAALNASQSLFLEPWLNLFCLLGMVLLFDGDQLAGRRVPGVPRGPGVPGDRRLFWAGVCFGFAAAVKIWAALPALVAWVLCLCARRGRLAFAGGFAAGIAVPCLPFLALAPSGFGRTVFFSELVQATHGRVGANPRVADITGTIGLSSVGVNPRIWQGVTAAAVLLLFVVIAWLRARRAGVRADPPGLVRAGQHHRGDRDAVLPVGMVRALRRLRRALPRRPAGAVRRPALRSREAPARKAREAEVPPDPGGLRGCGVHGARDRRDGGSRRLHRDHAVPSQEPEPGERPHPARRLRPHRHGLGDDRDRPVQHQLTRLPGHGRYRGHADRHHARQGFRGQPGVLQADTRVWQLAFQQAEYVWLIGNNGYTGARIAWTPGLFAYFVSHFRLIGLASSFPGVGNVPRGGLYVRRG